MEGICMEGIIENLYVNKELYSSLLLPVCNKYKLTMAEMLVLLFLSKNAGSDTASDIVNKLKITKSHVSASVRDLKKEDIYRAATRAVTTGRFICSYAIPRLKSSARGKRSGKIFIRDKPRFHKRRNRYNRRLYSTYERQCKRLYAGVLPFKKG